VLAWEISARMTASGMGRKLIALRDAPVALGAVGVSNSRVRLVAYVVASAMAALAGSLFAHESLFISSESFGLDRLILLILAVLFGGAGTMIGPVIGVIALVFIDEAGVSTGGSNTVILGAAIIIFLGYSRGGLGALATYVWRRLRPKRPEQGSAHHDRSALELPTIDGDAVLRVEHVSVAFGGVQAMSDVSLVLEPGRVLGLIGPNGAGKTTLVNTVTGYVHPTEGSVLLDDQVVSGRRPDRVVDSGVVRTFQTAQLIPDVTVVGNVALGFARSATAADWGEVLDTRGARRDTREALRRAGELLAALDVDTAPGQPVRDQPYATQRLTEIARALAAAPRFVLLDEPGAGLNEHERTVLGRVIRRVAASGIGVLLIDHNVAFVADVSDSLHVLDGGRTIAEGTPDEVLDRTEVVNAYLGGVV
jgi:branched-chain amino acid transport system permease protein